MRKSWVGMPCSAFGFLCVALLVASVSLATAESRARITVIDNASRVKLAHSTHPLVAAANDLGRVDPNLRLERMLLILGPTDEMKPTLHSFVDSLHDKKSTNYHRWLTPEQFGERFGPSQADIAKITGWLQQQGFDGIKVARGRSHIEFSGSAQNVERTFQTQLHSYLRGTEKHLANSSDIAIPQALSGIVRGVNLENFSFSKPTVTQATAIKLDESTGRWTPTTPNSSFFSPIAIDPNDLAKIYGLDRVYESGIDGHGVTIAIVARTTVELTDVETFRQAYHLPPNDPNIIVNGPPAFNPFGGDAVEASLDVEWAGAVAPNATVNLVASASSATTDGTLLSSAYIVENNLADVVGVSFHLCEPNIGGEAAIYNALWTQASAQGMSVFVAAGDAGAADCDFNNGQPAQNGLAVNGLGSTPFNTSVGGTEFSDAGNIPQYWTLDGANLIPNGYIPEMVWNESCDPNLTNCPFGLRLDGTGGGVSTLYAKPVWQNSRVLGVPNDNTRDVPDVSVTGANHDGYVVCALGFGGCTAAAFGDQTILARAIEVGGTSASAQVFAGIMALIDQKQNGRQGLANYGLYQLAANETYANCDSSTRTDPTVPAPAECVFNDVTVGNNGVPGNDTLGANPPPGNVTGQLGYNATPGYDLATGLGSVNALNLINAWSSLGFAPSTTVLSATSPTSVQHGQPVSFSVSVAGTSGRVVPTGSVGLIAKTNAPFSTGIGVGGGTLVNGVISGPLNNLPGGQYNVVAHYAGDGNFASSDSDPVAVNITSEASSVTITGLDQNGQPQPSPLTFGYGTPFTITFNVSSASGAGTPTGTVTLLDGGQPVAQVPVNNAGITSLVNCSPFFPGFCLGFGSHTLTASYSGDAGLSPSTSAPFIYNMVKGTPTTFTGISASQPGNVLFVYNFNQNSLPIFPTGTVTLTDHLNRATTTVKTYTANGKEINDYVFLPPGNHFVTVEYSGDSNYLPVVGAPIFVSMPALSGVPTTLTLTPLNNNPIVIGQPVSLRATVTSADPNTTAIPTGQLFWISQSAFIGQPLSDLTDGSAVILGIMPTVGPIVVQYAGDSVFAPTVAILETNSAPGTTTVAVSSNLQTATPSEQVTLTAVVTPPAQSVFPTGNIQFFDAVNGAAPVALGVLQPLLNVPNSNGASVIAMPTNLPLGTHVITASYTGDVNYASAAASASTPVTINVVSSLPPNPVSSDFGSVNVGAASGPQSVNVLFSAAGMLSAIKVRTQGAANAAFNLVDPGTCVTGTPFSAGQSCMATLTFAPDFAGTNMGAIVLTDASGNILGTQYVGGQGLAPQIVFDFGAPLPISATTSNAFNDDEFLASDGLGNFYIADNGNQRVVKVPPPGCITASCQTVVASSSHGLQGADGVALDGAGNLYVSDPVANQVVMIPPGCANNVCTQVIASQAAGQISTPRKLAVDAAGDLFIADLNNNRVVEVPVGCTSSACQTSLGSGLNGVYGVAVDAAGNVFISDSGNGQVVKLPAGCTGGSCQTTVASGLTLPKGIGLDAAGNLYIAESTQVVEVPAAGGNQITLATSSALGASGTPTDVALSPSGNLFIADPGDSQVAKLFRVGIPNLNFSTPTAFGTPSAPQVITVENIGTQSLNLASVTADTNAALDPATTTCASGSVVLAGAACQLGVEYFPSMLVGLGPFPVAGTVTLVDNTRNRNNATQTIFMTGPVSNSQTITFAALPSSVNIGVAPITLQATATSGLPVSFAVTGPASLSGSTLTITAAGSVTVTASQPGDASFAAATPVSQTITVQAVPADFALAGNQSSLTVKAGQSGAVTITVTPSGGFNGQISFSCSQQTLVTCSFLPATLTPNGAPVSTTLTLAASSTITALGAPAGQNRAPLTLAFGTFLASFTFGMVLIGMPRRNRRNRVVGVLAALLLGLAIISMAGCGSGGGAKPQPQTGVVTVSASSGNNSHSIPLTITVTP